MSIHNGSYAEMLGDVAAQLIFTSPPYNIGSRQPRQDGRRKHGQFDPKSYGGITGYPDSLPEDEYQQSQREFLIWAAHHLTADGTLVYNHKPRRRNGAMIHPAAWFLHPDVTCHLTLMEEVIWDRGSTHNHSNRLMWPQTERLYVFRRSDGAYSYLSSESTPQRADLWKIALSSRQPGKVEHACPFAEELASAVIQAWSKPGDLVCDPYTGSGTTGAAALRLGRKFVGCEQDRNYHRAAVQRLKAVAA